MPSLTSAALKFLALLAVTVSATGFAAIPSGSDTLNPSAEQTSGPAPTSTAEPTGTPTPTAIPTPGAAATGTPAAGPAVTTDPPQSSDAPTPPAVTGTPSGSTAPALERVLYIAIPHPDDEFEAASLYANTPGYYKVFVVMTRGESTYHCEPVGYQLSVLNGASAAPTVPQGMRTHSCEQARLQSWVSYFTAMSQTDTSLPGDFGPVVVTSAFPTQGVQLAREPRSREGSGAAATMKPFTDTTAQVWTDKQGRGALIAFDLGDGDLTSAKVAWAMHTVLQNKSKLGIDAQLPDYGVVGGYSNIADRGCYVYPHPDHAAVADAMRTADFGLRMQSAATCRTDAGASSTATVPANELDAAYPADGSSGAFATSYGWLEVPAIARTDQSSEFMAIQTFDVRHQHVPATRISGSDRYSTGVAISQAAFPTTAPVVYLASGTDYPDALSAGAAAAKQGGPLLLTAPGFLPAPVGRELARLRPSTIVIVGGTAAISTNVALQAEAMAPSVVRIAGSDRYDTSRRVAEYAFPAGSAPGAYLASGASFADALSATGAAGSQGSPVLLTPRGDTSAATVSTITRLAPKDIFVVGGTSVIPPSVDAALSSIGHVRRLAGGDRFATNAAVLASFSSAGSAMVASGLNFPDALTGAAWAGHARLPLLLARGGCLTKPSTDTIYTLGVDSLTLIGGADVINDDVARGTVC